MSLRLTVIEGPKKGEVLIIRDDILIGRKNGDLILDDSKVSSSHARIFQDENGDYQIEDLGSSNGTYVDDIKITKFPLKPGNKVAIGRSVLEVGPEAAAEKPMEKGTWQEVVDNQLSLALQAFQINGPQPQTWRAFTQSIALEFVQGLQTGSTYTFGFGPRKIGKLCPEGLLFDPDSPQIAFSIVPSETSLCVLHPDTPISINGKKPSKAPKKIKIGDRISFGQTVIVVKIADAE